MTATLTNTHPPLRRFWSPVALESDVPEGAPLGVRLLGERWLANFRCLHHATVGAADDGKPTLSVERDGWRIHQLDTQMVDGANLAAPESSGAAAAS